MEEKYKIKEGDLVKVDSNVGQCNIVDRAEVLRVPQSLSNLWILRKGSQIIYCNEPCTVHKLTRSEF